jgi:hypothetical protein
MKKVLLLSLSLLLGFSAIAQQRVTRMKDDTRKGVASAKMTMVGKEAAEFTTPAETYAPQAQQSVVINRWDDLEEAETMMTYYDLQSNQYVANRMVQFPNGSVAITATMSHENNQSATDRGTGYNFYSNGEWDEWPEARFEPWKTGWPSIAQYGATGEILLCHGNAGMQCFTREVAGQGEWQYRGALPPYPDGYPYTTEYATWPRVVTCGENHDIIIAVAALQHSISDDETDVRTCMWRSTDATTWTVSYGPLADLGMGYEVGFFSADDYCLAANGHNVSLLYSGCITNSTWLFKSDNDGESWDAIKVWEDPYEGRDLDDETFFYEDTLFRPMNGAVVIDNNGVTHVALNTFEMIRTEENEPGYYSYYYGRAVDGILYWNDTQVAPIQSEDGNPHHAARLWWPAGDGYVQMHLDSTKWIGFIPMFEGYDWNNDNFYHGGTEYVNKFYGASGHPALSCDPEGNLALAYSTPNTTRMATVGASQYYYRNIFASYKSAEEDYWHVCEDNLTEDFMHNASEMLFTIGVNNTVNPGEFWFGYQEDPTIGFYWGSNATQASGTENRIVAVKVMSEFVSVPETEAKDVVYGIYPNPVTGNEMYVQSAMDADATITIVNLVGQTVKQFNKSLQTGNNQITVDLKSGVYFCTITANGFSRTVKFVVK